jgi:hypothetical protein
MVFDKERNAWVERNCLPVDLDEMVDRTRHKKGNAGQTGSVRPVQHFEVYKSIVAATVVRLCAYIVSTVR